MAVVVEKTATAAIIAMEETTATGGIIAMEATAATPATTTQVTRLDRATAVMDKGTLVTILPASSV
jgi:hypothetical protein